MQEERRRCTAKIAATINSKVTDMCVHEPLSLRCDLGLTFEVFLFFWRQCLVSLRVEAPIE
jgi:hypothetical protein